MYQKFVRWMERALKIPPKPDPPPGDETATMVFRASPRFYRYRVVLWCFAQAPIALMSIVAITGLGVASANTGGAGFIFAGLGLLTLALEMAQLLVSWVCLRIDYDYRWYVLTDRSLRVREGALIVREMTVTFANIQNLSVQQGPLQRVLGIADLKVDTAGGGGSNTGGRHSAGFSFHSASFRGVDNAPEIKELMQRRLRPLKDAGLGDHDDVAAETQAALASIPQVSVLLRELADEARALRETAAAYAGRR
ncbi:MAG: PH domain-containing protein [Verrucomicrobiales bacterium]